MPAHFGVVERYVYRCAFPAPPSYPFLRRLGVRTIINLLDRRPEEYDAFMRETGVRYAHLAVKGNKETCEDMDRGKVATALALILDARNHPVLIHCRSGKHRTGALVGCLRMLQHASLEAACAEYVRYCQHKQRDVDKLYIERFDPRTLRDLAPPPEYLPPWMPRDCCSLPSMEAQLAAAGATPSSAPCGGTPSSGAAVGVSPLARPAAITRPSVLPDASGRSPFVPPPAPPAAAST